MSRGRRSPSSSGAPARPSATAALDEHLAALEALGQADRAAREALGLDSDLAGSEQFWQGQGAAPLRRIATASVVDALKEGDLAGARRAACRYLRARGLTQQAERTEALGDRQLEEARRLLGAMAAARRGRLIRRPPELDPALPEDKAFIEHLPYAAELAEDLRERIDPERVARRPWRLDEQGTWHDTGGAWNGLQHSLAEAHSAIRAALRHYEGGEPIALELAMTEPAFVEFCQAHRDIDGFCGPAPELHDALTQGYRVKRGSRSLSLCAELSLELEGRHVVLTPRVAIGETRSDNPTWLARTAQRRICEATGAELEVAAELYRPPSEGEELPAPGAALSLEQLLGRDRCEHPGARWRTSKATGLSTLVCPACHRNLVCVPSHRLPAGDRDGWSGEEAHYLELEAARASLADDPRPVTSVAELRARDGVVETDPRAYAVGRVEPARPGRGGDLRSAFAGSRRG